MKFDDASWHYGGDWPEGLDHARACTHIGIFLAWIILSDLGNPTFFRETADEVTKLRQRMVTPGRFFELMDGKFVDDMVCDATLPFVKYYYASDKWLYMEDYGDVLAGGLPTYYHVQDSWANYDRMADRINQRYGEWQRQAVSQGLPPTEREIGQLFITALNSQLKSIGFRYLRSKGYFQYSSASFHYSISFIGLRHLNVSVAIGVKTARKEDNERLILDVLKDEAGKQLWWDISDVAATESIATDIFRRLIVMFKSGIQWDTAVEKDLDANVLGKITE